MTDLPADETFIDEKLIPEASFVGAYDPGTTDEIADPPVPSKSECPAAHLEGETLENGWLVGARIPKPPGATGGYFSASYFVERDGQKAFLKALDFAEPLAQAADPTTRLEELVSAYNFERDLVRQCRNMRHVVNSLDDGTLRFPEAPMLPVPYIIFEAADRGDIRSFIQTSTTLDNAWMLRSLHNTAVGLMGLHNHEISHQDLKPSNVLVFEEQGGHLSKIGDFGTASIRDGGPRNHWPIAGDRNYAPPELLYGELSADWRVRRLGADIYQLGSLIVYYILGSGLTSLIMTKLSPGEHWMSWGGSFGDALPFIRDAFDKVMEEFAEGLPYDLAELETLVRYLCDPDPNERGHPRNRAGTGNPFAMERFVSRLDHLARLAEWKLRRL